MENIGLQDSLLSRFDLLFVMLDLVESDQDHMISVRVVRMHRYRYLLFCSMIISQSIISILEITLELNRFEFFEILKNKTEKRCRWVLLLKCYRQIIPIETKERYSLRLNLKFIFILQVLLLLGE
jgi:hypothetical protein